MTSYGCNEIHDNYMPTFKIQGQMYHRIGSLLPVDGPPKCLQMYFVNGRDEQAQIRSNYVDSVDMELLQSLQDMLYTHNNYVRSFKTTMEMFEQNNTNIENVKVVIHENKIKNAHKRTTNALSVNEIAVVITGEEYGRRDIVIEGRNSVLKRICDTHRSYDPLQYPLLFPYGTDGYDINILQFNSNKTVSARQYYTYRLMKRDDNYLLLCGDLLNVYIVDMYVKMESERLLYMRLNQSRLRSEEYVHLRDALLSDGIAGSDMGKVVILPSSYVGGPRYMAEKVQDGMCYVRAHGTADLFITMTCNPKWIEIQENLITGQRAKDHYDFVARVFKLKLKLLMEIITKPVIFGNVKSYMLTIEWQKRGLPHAHILIWLEIRISPDNIDKIISAEIPDPKSDPKLFEIVKNHMIHGPCGRLNNKSPCMDNNKCSKQYPRAFVNATQMGEDGYPLYRRRSPQDGGIECIVGEHTIDNRWVVPYSPLLLQIFNAHINIESCNSVKAVKYICKYVCKGGDLATISLENNEIERYVNGRYISSCEAVWRIFAFAIHKHYPAIVHLSVHLENGQRVYYTPDNILNKVQTAPKTTLTAFFELCKQDEYAKTLLYHEVPSYYTWNKTKFVRRKQGTPVPEYNGVHKDHAIGRVYTVNPNNRECYYLRMLLFHIRGLTSFDDLKTVDNLLFPTYQMACEARGLLANDNNWIETLQDAAMSKSPYQIRELFIYIVIYCQPANPLALYNQFKEDMSSDILHRFQTLNESITYNDDIFNECLLLLEEKLVHINGKVLKDYYLPEPCKDNNTAMCAEYLREISYDNTRLEEVIQSREPLLNSRQIYVYQEILKSIDQNAGNVYYLDASGGTGKTFLLNTILAKVRFQKHIAIAVASSGIAATLLDGGRTVHSTFKLPLNMISNSEITCNISKNSGIAKVLQNCALIIWDECSMSHKVALEAINRTLQDIRNNQTLMGGVTMLLAGDFRQTLPVVQRGTRADIICAALKSSYLWPDIRQLPPLQQNMRLTSNNDDYAKDLLKLGNGTFPNKDNKINLTNFGSLLCSEEQLIESVWPGIENISSKSYDWISERAIVAPRNCIVNDINNYILQKIDTEDCIYYAIDEMVEKEEATCYPTEFLNSLDPPGLSPYKLHLKVGIPVILIRNMEPPRLCNGTRLLIKRVLRNTVEVTILTGCGKGDNVYLPRIPLISSDLPFEFRRVQFPLKLSFSISINKSQGQTYNVIGLHLKEPCFSHGQLYVACSRITDKAGLYFFAPEEYTENVVYPEIL